MAVPGEGHPETEVVFVGEGPGYNEDQQGRPFVGAAGNLLTDLLASIGWRRDEVFITNVVKCRPPGNRDPEPDEIAACAPYLRRQLEVLDPALLVTLGRCSRGAFMPGARISGAHGTVRHVDPATGAADADALALYHPAAAFRQAGLRETLFEDTTRLPEALIASRERRAARSGGETERALQPEPVHEPPAEAARKPALAPEPEPEPEPVAVAPLPPLPTATRIDPDPPVAVSVPADSTPALEPAPVLDPIPDDQMRLF